MSGEPDTAALAPPAEELGAREARAMHILHVVAPAPYGGLERVVHALVGGHTGRGHRLTVAAIVAPDAADEHPFFGPVRESGAGLEVVRVRARDYAAERAVLRRLLLRLRPDVVHTHGYRPDVLDAGVARRLGIPTITTVHGFTRGGWKNRAYEWLQRRSFRRFDAVVAVSRAMARDLEGSGVPAQRLHLLANAWTPGEPALERALARAELRLPDSAWVVGFAGRLSPEKGADVLLDALGRLADVPVHACVIGEGSERERLRRRAQRPDLAGRVRWQGALPAAHRFFRAFDAFVLSSRTEGTPMVLFEAIAAGVPVVATAVGGVPDVISPVEAMLVPAEDPEALAAALRACQADPAGAARRAAAASERLARDFSAASWLAAYEELYRKLLRPERRKAEG